MDAINLPNVDPEPEPESEVETPQAPPQIEVMVNDADDSPPVQEIFKDIAPSSAAAPKKKRQPSQAQLDNLAKMRVKRAEKRAQAKAEKEAKESKIPQNAMPVPRKAPVIQEAPPMPSMNSADGFLNFMEYMEKYKNLKDNWKKREMEKARAYMQKKEPETKEPKKTETKVEKKPVSKPPSLLSNHATSNNTYSDYF